VLLLGGSASTLGLIGFLNTVPNLIWGLPAGALADRYDRRKLLLGFQGANMAIAVLLAVLWATDSLTVPLMGAIAVVGGSLGTLSFPAFQGMIASMVPKRELESAVAVNSLSLQVARFAGPALAGFTLLGGLFGTPPVAFMLPGIVRFQLDAGPGTLGALTAAIGAGSLLGALVLLRLSRRSNKGEPALAGFFGTALAVAGVGVSGSIPLSLFLGVAGGFAGTVFVGLATVVVQAMSSDEMRARAMAIWAAAFVGVLPFGALITAGLAALFGPGGAVLVDGLAMAVGGVIVLALRPELAWLGCAALPEACVAATNPAAVAMEHEPELVGAGGEGVSVDLRPEELKASRLTTFTSPARLRSFSGVCRVL
jgi:hypothetical protein